MDIDIFLVHGVREDNDVEQTYTPFVEQIRRRLPMTIHANFYPVNWNMLIYEKEKQVYNWIEDMGWKKLRQFGAFFIADILAYAPPESIPGPGDFYYDVNTLLKEKFNEVSKSHPKSKKVIFSHSMGTQICYSFSFQKEVDILFTAGSPILYFSVRFKNFGKFPEATLRKMVNFWKYGDPVATRISRNPNLSKCEDVQVKSANPLYLMPLKSHSIYWNHSGVHDKVASELINLAKVA